VAREQHAQLEAERDELIALNDFLWEQNIVMEKCLAVRDAVLRAFQQTLQIAGPSEQGGTAGVAPSHPRTITLQEMRSIAQSIQKTPPEVDLDVAFPQHRFISTVEIPREGPPSAVMNGDCQGNFPSAAPSMITTAQTENIASRIVDGAVLMRHPSIPSATDPDMIRAIFAMSSPSDLCEYWRRWTLDLAGIWESAKAADFDEESVRACENSVSVMTSMWWHAAQLKPDFLVKVIAASLPKDSIQHPMWADIAV